MNPGKLAVAVAGLFGAVALLPTQPDPEPPDTVPPTAASTPVPAARDVPPPARRATAPRRKVEPSGGTRPFASRRNSIGTSCTQRIQRSMSKSSAKTIDGRPQRSSSVSRQIASR